MDEGDRTGSDEGRSDGTDPGGDDPGEVDKPGEVGKPGESDESLESDESSEDVGGGERDGAIGGDRSSDPSDWTDHRGATQSDGDGVESDRGLWDRFRHDREGALMWIREILSSVAIVLAVGLLLFGVSGVWPPMVAVESGSMEPNMEVGDLVFVTEPGRLAPDAADDETGVVTHDVGERVDYRTFGSYGSVVIYQPPGRTASPIIHRAMFHVEEGENWYDRADSAYHSAESCSDLRNCPAPHGGYITLGDNNGVYDQARGIAEPVKRDWVTGVARVRVPYLGYVRLVATGKAEPRDAIDAVAG
ncbi:S26 family signal peptidase [Halorubrum sp. SD626R]|uniref:S26 family signal peptidase n=1 Tax=Halorubrum TaxID=56688 RepID=UPI0010F75A23|nr:MULTISPECIES: S26 family signal peptidase [Halorubrum]TKX79300.1 S26 family signal peptidase [Halorubrum sp. SD626R]